MKQIITILILMLVSTYEPNESLAQPLCPDCPSWRGPYGDYCPGPRHGWYGARKKIMTMREAEAILRVYFSRFENVRVGNIREKKSFFEAEVKDEKGRLLDIVIVDKRTGRIRSIY